MKYFIIVICVAYLVLHYHTFHTYKTEIWKGKVKQGFGWVLGSVFGVIMDAFVWYWLFKLIGL